MLEYALMKQGYSGCCHLFLYWRIRTYLVYPPRSRVESGKCWALFHFILQLDVIIWSGMPLKWCFLQFDVRAVLRVDFETTFQCTSPYYSCFKSPSTMDPLFSEIRPIIHIQESNNEWEITSSFHECFASFSKIIVKLNQKCQIANPICEFLIR